MLWIKINVVDPNTLNLDPNTLNLDPDTGFWFNLDPDPDPSPDPDLRLLVYYTF